MSLTVRYISIDGLYISIDGLGRPIDECRQTNRQPYYFAAVSVITIYNDFISTFSCTHWNWNSRHCLHRFGLNHEHILINNFRRRTIFQPPLYNHLIVQDILHFSNSRFARNLNASVWMRLNQWSWLKTLSINFGSHSSQCRRYWSQC